MKTINEMNASWMNDVEYVVKQYRSLQCGSSDFADTPLIQACLWTHDNEMDERRVYAVRGTILWGLQQLEMGDTHEQQSAETVRMRYVDGVTVNVCESRLQLSRSAIISRQKRGIERLAQVLWNAQEMGMGHEQRSSWVARCRYVDSNEIIQKWVRFLSIAETALTGADVECLIGISWNEIEARLSQMNWVLQDPLGRLSLQPPAKEFVRKQLTQDEKKEWHIALSAYYQTQNHPYENISHQLQAGTYESAVEQFVAQWGSMTYEQANLLVSSFPFSILPIENQHELYLIQGHIAAAQQHNQKAINAYENVLKSSTVLLRARACFYLGEIYQTIHLSSAEEYYIQGGQILAQDEGEAAEKLRIHIELSQIWILICRHHRYEDASAQLLNLHLSIHEHWIALNAQYEQTWAEFYLHQNQVETGLPFRWNAWHLAYESNDSDKIAKIGYALATDLINSGQLKLARHHLQNLQEVAVQFGNHRLNALCEKIWAEFAMLEEQDASLALPHYLNAYAYFKGSDAHQMQGVLCHDLAEIYLMLQQSFDAQPFLQEGLDIANRKGNESLRDRLLALKASYSLLQGGLTERHRKIIQFVADNGAIRTAECATLLAIGSRQASRELKELVNIEMIVRVGKGRGIKYILQGE